MAEDKKEKKVPIYVDAPEGSPEGIKYRQIEYSEGDWKEFKAIVPEFDNLQKFITHYGEPHVLDMCNQAVSYRIRGMVKNNLPKCKLPEDKIKNIANKLVLHPDRVLFNAKDALEWKPQAGSKGVSDEIKQINKDMVAAFGRGDMVAGAKLHAQFIALVTQAHGELPELEESSEEAS